MPKTKMIQELTPDGQIRVTGADQQESRDLKGAGVWDLYLENLGSEFSHVIALPEGNPEPTRCYGFVVSSQGRDQEIANKVQQFAKS